MRIGDAIKQLRIERGITQAELAEASKMRQSAISRIESNKAMPKVSKFENLASALGVPVDHFFSQRPKILNEGGLGEAASVSAEYSETAENLPGNQETDKKVIEAYKKLDPGSTRKLAIDILLFAGTEDKKGPSE
jgi:transcriptional regulator with XRE-family HTH domain